MRESGGLLSIRVVLMSCLLIAIAINGCERAAVSPSATKKYQSSTKMAVRMDNTDCKSVFEAIADQGVSGVSSSGHKVAVSLYGTTGHLYSEVDAKVAVNLNRQVASTKLYICFECESINRVEHVIEVPKSELYPVYNVFRTGRLLGVGIPPGKHDICVSIKCDGEKDYKKLPGILSYSVRKALR
jgi:hypothetical protein